MAKKTLSAGDAVESKCTKCRKTTNHTIIAMVDDLPAKVQCNTCDGQHKYRPETAPKKPATRRVTKPKIQKKNDWLKLTEAADSKKAVAYSMQASFKDGVLITHPTFGLGIVQNAVGPQKIEVLFEDGLKKMRCL